MKQNSSSWLFLASPAIYKFHAMSVYLQKLYYSREKYAINTKLFISHLIASVIQYHQLFNSISYLITSVIQ